MFNVTFCNDVGLKEILVSAPWRLRDNSAEICRNYVQDCTHKL